MPTLQPLLLLPLLCACFLRLPAPAAAACSPKKCGELNITYPFWLEEPGQPPCGSPSFQLNCNSSQALLSRSMFGAYQVVQVFAENSSFLAVDNNLPLDDGCPPWWFNISLGLGLSPFVISKRNKELLILDKCTKKRVTPPGFTRTGCANESFYRLGGEYGGHRELRVVPPACRLSVVPVLGFQDDDDYVLSMRQGFLLEWTVPSDDCPKCEASGGQCRYANDGTGFSCHCSGDVYPEKCGGSTRIKMIFIAVGAVLGAGAFFLFIFYVLYQRKRKKQAVASNEFMRSGSSTTSYSKDLELGGSPHIFTFEELEVATDGFSASRELGDGGFGTVYKGKLKDGRVVAVKRLYKNNYRRVEQFLNEPAVDMNRSHSEINLANMALNRIQNHEVVQLVDPELGYDTDPETKRTIDRVAEVAFQCLQMEREMRPSIKEVVEILTYVRDGDYQSKSMRKKASQKEDVHLLTDALQFSPDTVIHRFHSQSTNHSVASNASGL
ncbi:hypothetical protein ZWY2020_031611 [Hordeum vulgare]|nr:hypothetical protein ZWY2020_031611 [Hordeum vulgare]